MNHRGRPARGRRKPPEILDIVRGLRHSAQRRNGHVHPIISGSDGASGSSRASWSSASASAWTPRRRPPRASRTSCAGRRDPRRYPGADDRATALFVARVRPSRRADAACHGPRRGAGTPRACAPSSTCARTTSTGTASGRRSRRRSGGPGSPSTACPFPTGPRSRPTCSTGPSRRPAEDTAYVHCRGGRERSAAVAVALLATRSRVDDRRGARGRRGPLADLPAAALADRGRARLGGLREEVVTGV